MGLRNVGDPFGGNNPLIDKLIGNAYQVVQYVAKYLKEIRYVAENMENVYIVATNVRDTAVVSAVLPASNATRNVPLPEGVKYAEILNTAVVVVTENGSVVFPSSTTFTFTVEPNGLNITTKSAALAGQRFKWSVTHGLAKEV